MTNPLRPLVGRLIAHTAPKRTSPFADRDGRVTYYQDATTDGLVVSYYPPNDGIGPYIAAGRCGRWPYLYEQSDLFDAVRQCTGVNDIAYATARRQDWCIVELHWKSVETAVKETHHVQ